MDLFTRLPLFGLKFWIKKRVSCLQAFFGAKIRNAKIGNAGRVPCAQYQKKITALMLFSLSGVLGVWSHRSSQNEAIQKWEKTFTPSRSAIEALMKGLGLKKLEEANDMQRAIRKIPARLDQEGSIWYAQNAQSAQNAQWAVFFFGSDDVIQMQAYCSSCDQYPEQWQPLGMGWRGLEALIQLLKQKKTTPPVVQSMAQPKKKPVFRDPLELRY
jgi:hypothetical protein